MNPMTPGTAASWWLQLFGGFGTPLTTTAPAADTDGSWEGFAAVLSSMGVQAPNTPSEDGGTEGEVTDLASAAAALLAVTTSTDSGHAGDTRTTKLPIPGDEAILHPAEPVAAGGGVATTGVEATEAGRPDRAVPFGVDGSGAAWRSVTQNATEVADPSAVTMPSSTPKPTTGTDAAPTVGQPAATTGPRPTGATATVPATDVVMESAAMDPLAAPKQATATGVGTIDPSPAIPSPTTTTHPETTSAAQLETPRADRRGVRVEARDVLHRPTADDRPAPTVTAATTASVEGPEVRPQPQVFTVGTAQRELAGARTEQQTVTAPATAAATVETTTRHARLDDAMARLRVRRHERGTTERSEATQRATDLGARAAMRADAADRAPTPADTTAAELDALDLQDLPEVSDELTSEGQGTRSTSAPTGGTTTGAAAAPATSDTGTRERVTGLGERQPILEDVRPADPAPRPVNPAQTVRPETVDLGARLREAVVETMAQQARDQLLASTRETWQASVRVEPAHLGRVDLQVTRGTGGLEVILVTAHRDAAQALDGEVDELVDELIRRELEPARVTVRTTDRGLDAERQPGRQNPENDPTRSRREQDDTTESGAEEHRGRRGRGRDAHDQRQATA
jgi:flagellar hook-length control protein FliK